jgi:peptide/nickel transport system permease protein
MIDHITRTAATIGTSLPSFWFGIVLIFIFYVGLGWFPTGRLSTDAYTFTQTNPSFNQYTGMNTVDGILNGQLWITIDAIRHIVLPVVVLTTMQMALIVRIMRSSMLEALNKGYIIAARAKGLTEKEVINKHARRNALIPTITLSGMMVAAMLSGVVITEVVFGINGLGFWAAQAVLNLDVASIVGFTIFSGTIIVLANLIVDILYAYLDPRIRVD